MTNEIFVITGPESCGKTTLARQLANRWGAPLVNEAARAYLQEKDSYQKSDLLEKLKLILIISAAFLRICLDSALFKLAEGSSSGIKYNNLGTDGIDGSDGEHSPDKPR